MHFSWDDPETSTSIPKSGVTGGAGALQIVNRYATWPTWRWRKSGALAAFGFIVKYWNYTRSHNPWL